MSVKSARCRPTISTFQRSFAARPKRLSAGSIALKVAGVSPCNLPCLSATTPNKPRNYAPPEPQYPNASRQNTKNDRSDSRKKSGSEADDGPRSARASIGMLWIAGGERRRHNAHFSSDERGSQCHRVLDRASRTVSVHARNSRGGTRVHGNLPLASQRR